MTRKPFDDRFERAMVRTAADLLKRWHPSLVFCQSDEITLVFPPVEESGRGSDPPLQSVLYGGRTFKIVSTIAASASVSFSQYILQEDWSDVQVNNPSNRSPLQFPIFDARVLSTPDSKTAMQAVYWRHAFDCRRNAVQMVARRHFSHKALDGLRLSEILQKLRDEKNVHDFDSLFGKKTPVDPSIEGGVSLRKASVYGVFLKKEQVQREGYNPITQKICSALRGIVTARSFDWSLVQEDERVAMTMSKYWREGDPVSLEPLDYVSESI
eukprot:CAMPEP_0184644160 /NCGR_PEP_ID=MMETSP0308-20130426/922_1 /TAXON_ID=38269 /ORGANISM="Gloeochaete witrockiana, Strain SAG 46.84" /LENGTH=268 /DNA_ID=CAMNT_0027072535 /DNA_START=330 /DNA_END=1136 /DNA_ORIENTATION=+